MLMQPLVHRKAVLVYAGVHFKQMLCVLCKHYTFHAKSYTIYTNVVPFMQMLQFDATNALVIQTQLLFFIRKLYFCYENLLLNHTLNFVCTNCIVYTMIAFCITLAPFRQVGGRTGEIKSGGDNQSI